MAGVDWAGMAATLLQRSQAATSTSFAMPEPWSTGMSRRAMVVGTTFAQAGQTALLLSPALKRGALAGVGLCGSLSLMGGHGEFRGACEELLFGGREAKAVRS